MTKIDATVVRDRIHEVARRKAKLPDEVAYHVGFHMTDWFDDFEALSRFYADPAGFSDEEAHSILEMFLIHVPNHVAAAGKLYVDIPVTDIFEVGATKEDDGDDPDE